MRAIPLPVLAMLALATLGAGPARKKPDSPARQAAQKRALALSDSLAKTKVSGFVVLGRAASSSEKAARSLSDPPSGALVLDTSSLRGGRRAAVWKVKEDRGDVVELTSLRERTPDHCHEGGAADPVEIRAFARKVDLLPLLASEATETFSDGTAITFALGSVVGAPLLPKRGGWAVTAEGIVREQRIAAQSITLSYRAPKTFSFQQRRRAWGMGLDGTPAEPVFTEIPRANVVYLDGAAVLRGGDLSDVLREVQADAGPPADDGERLLDLASPCVRLKVLGKSGAGDPRGGGAAGLGGGRRPKVYRVPERTPLVYPDGSAAGMTLADMRWEDPSEAQGRLCKRLRVAVDSELCVRKAAAREDER